MTAGPIRHRPEGGVDLFLCHWPNPERVKWLADCVEFWNQVPGIGKIVILTPTDGVTGAKFQQFRRMEADRMGGKFYILADDDCLPLQPEVITVGLAVLKAHKQFSILSLWPQNANIVEWTPEGYQTKNDADVLEHVSVGGIRFCRKMPFSIWPPVTRAGYDAEHCQAIREAGYRVGYFRNLKMNHLGEGHSTLAA